MLKTAAVCWDGGSALAAVVLLLIGIAACQVDRSSVDPLERLRGALLDEVAGWRAADHGVVYDDESIYSYIDGHAEVYLAYGMRRCLARRYVAPEGEADLVVDIFELASPADAFGVSTHDRDGEPVAVGNDGLLRYGWLSFWKGPFFVSIYAEGESDRSRAAVLELGRSLDVAIQDPGARPPIVERLPAAGLDPSSIRFLRDYQILNNNVYVSDRNVLALGPETPAALGSYQRQGDSGWLLVVAYPNSGRRDAAARGFAEQALRVAVPGQPVQLPDESWYGLGGGGRLLVLVLAADSERFVTELLDDLAGEEAP